MDVDALEAEPTGLGDGQDDQQEEKDGDRGDFPRCGSGNSVDGGPFAEKRGDWRRRADGYLEPGRA